MTRIGVVDHGAGNLVSLTQALEAVGAEVTLATRPDQLEGCAGIVLPGVGSTAGVMEGIRAGGFEDHLITTRAPLFGICVGMQVLFETSEEDGARGLGLIPGVVRRLIDAPTLPHIGWNDLDKGDDPLLSGVDDEVYFVHSYAPVPTDGSVVTAWSTHGARFVAAVRQGRVCGTQFHPERSGETGLRLLSNFVSEVAA